MTAQTLPASTSSAGHTPHKLAVSALLLAVFVVPISVAGTAVTLPAIARDLGSEATALQWVVNGFNVAFALFTLVWGGLSDRIGYRRTFTLGLATILVGSLASAIAPNLIVLDGARVLAGIGAAAVTTGASSVLSNALHGRARSAAFGALGTVLGLGLALGPAIAGALASWLGWRGVFGAFVIAFVVSLALVRFVPAPSATSAGKQSLIDFDLFTNRRFLAIALVTVAQGFGFITLVTYMPSVLAALFEMDEGQAGVAMLVMLVPVLLAPALAVKLVGRFARITLTTIVYVALGAMLVANALLMVLGPTPSFAMLITPMILLGISMGLPLGLVDGEALASVPVERSGAAAGLFNFLRIGSEAVAVALYGVVLSAVVRSKVSDVSLADGITAGTERQPDVFIAAFTAAQGGVLAVVAILAVAIVVLLRSGRPRRAS